jgi:hypothetical protein
VLRVLPGSVIRWGSVYFVRRYRKAKLNSPPPPKLDAS